MKYCGYITYCLHLTLQTSRSLYCPVCFQRCTKSNTSSAACGHVFCDDCWLLYCISQLKIGLSSGMQWEKNFLFRCKAKLCNFAALSKMTILSRGCSGREAFNRCLWHFWEQSANSIKQLPLRKEQEVNFNLSPPKENNNYSKLFIKYC